MKPILFNTPMVQAILDGRKTETRRIIKPKCKRNFIGTGIDGKPAECRMIEIDAQEIVRHAVSPYQVGDVLYVRETWNDNPDWFYSNKGPHFLYKASNADFTGGWRPSIHMPKEAARIFLRVTDVKAERLQDITEDGAKAEGCGIVLPTGGWEKNPLNQFVDVWNSTVKKSDRDKFGWNANPWVWVISFERCEKS